MLAREEREETQMHCSPLQPAFFADEKLSHHETTRPASLGKQK
jgi:hypothetical protein